MLGSFPADAQAFHRQADGLDTQTAGGPAFGMAGLGQKVQRPQAGGLVEQPGTVVQEVFERLGMALIEAGLCRVGPGGLLLEAVEVFAGEGMDGMMDRGGSTAQVLCDPGRGQAVSRLQKDLTAAHGERIAAEKAVAQAASLTIAQERNKEFWFHTSLFARSCN